MSSASGASSGSTGLRTIYCVDSSTLMNLGRHFALGARPFARLWRNIEALIDADLLIAPDEVLAEIEQGTDDLVDWAHQHRRMFQTPGPYVVDEVTRLVTVHGESFAGVSRDGPHADPWVVALAIHETTLTQTGIVVCDERRSPGRIPSICEAEGIPCVDHTQWFDREGWGFA